ncbi:hypothetical protein DSM112329_02596 [Paraconexibacter sp. AEG42_29]|uniref:Peptidase M14 domain-containing protein n=1 Tax=Paraconexibacter sp. AEG42_29 TaxID=2997339 RepID=A0AAU7AVS3_9ACTN
MLAAGLLAPASSGVARADAPRVSVERVALNAPRLQVPLLERMGIEVTEDVSARSATVILRSGAERRRLRAAGFAPVAVVSDLAARLRRQHALRTRGTRAAPATATLRASGLPSGRTTYRTAAEIQAALDQLVAAHPGLVRRVELPRRSIEGRAITGVELARDVNRADDGRPVYVVVGAHHAREWPSAELPLEFAMDLVARQAEPRIAALLTNLRIVVIPVENPDGFQYSRGNAAGGQLDALAAIRRRNCRAVAGDPAGGSCAAHRGVDLNRNYGAFWGGLGASTSTSDETYRGAAPWSEPEAAAFHEYTQRLPVTGVQSLHNIAGLVLRPPGFRALGLAPDERKLKALGDAMAAATGYQSQYGYELYEVTGATEDWNYVTQGAFAYTIETAGAGPGDTDFHGAYTSHVVDQYLGGGASPGPAGKGVREALLLAAEQAADSRDHVVVRGHAPPGRLLRLHKSFTTATSPLCSETLSGDACGPVLPAQQVPDMVDTVVTVPSSGVFLWHAGPSTRPFVRAAGRRETFELTCERDGSVVARKAVFADRGQVVDVDPCDPASIPRTGAPKQSPAVARVAVGSPGQRLSAARRARRVSVRVTCPVACTASVTLAQGSAAVGRRASVALRAKRASTIGVPLSAAGRQRLGRGGAPRSLRATVVIRTKAANSATLVRTVKLK